MAKTPEMEYYTSMTTIARRHIFSLLGPYKSVYSCNRCYLAKKCSNSAEVFERVYVRVQM